MLYQINHAVRIARWEVLAAVLPAPAKLVEMRCVTQGFLRTAEDSVETLAVLAAIAEAYMYAQRHHGIFILPPCVALHADFGGKVVMKWTRLLCGSASMSHNDFGDRCNHFTIDDEHNEARDKRTRDRYRQARVSRGGDGEQGSRRVSQARVPT